MGRGGNVNRSEEDEELAKDRSKFNVVIRDNKVVLKAKPR
jgi:hypothetical protein